ncbi:MAG: hypothetical protein INR71_03605 [Terriglobus roseus]|nr:hypothetical protein [Terriglobus roseus]
MYIKALEAEVLRLKEVFQDSSKERDTMASEREAMASEIRRLKDLLSAHGISSEAPPSSLAFESIGTMSSAASHTGSSSYYGGTASTGQTSPPHRSAMSASPTSAPQSAVPTMLDHDQVGIDFVLAYD